jgi:hypothetical protein
MKTLILITLLFGASLASGVSDYPSLYIPASKPIVVASMRAEINFRLFIEHLGLIESSNDWKIVNPFGAMGKFQFLQTTLEMLGYNGITPDKFRVDPNIFPEKVQEQALEDLIQYNERCLRNFTQYIGQVINGVHITKAGLIAASHLAGPGGVIKFLTGVHNAKDKNGSSVQRYLTEFQSYNV